MGEHSKDKKEWRRFFLITFGIAWGIPGLLLLLSSLLGFSVSLEEGAPLSFLYVWAPAISAFTVILIHTGWRGLALYFRNILAMVLGVPWYTILTIANDGRMKSN